jgi:hypothetical protein
LRADLRLCDRWGIPHSHFLGGPNEWSDLDRAKAHAYADYMLTVCPQCGTRPDEWDPEQGGDRAAYVADFHVCPGCSVTGELAGQVNRDEHVPGRSITLVRRDVYLAREAEMEARMEAANRG